jgi:hypothetical protein
MIGPWTYRGPLPEPPAQSTSGPGGIQGLYPGVHAAAAGDEAWARGGADAWAAEACAAAARSAAALAAAALSAAAFSAAAFSAAAFSAAALAAAAFATAARAAAARAAAAWADELLAAAPLCAARLSAANADAFSLDAGGGVDIAAEAVGATGAAVKAEWEAQAPVTRRVSAHRIAPKIARNTKAPDSITRGSFPIPSPVVKLRLEISCRQCLVRRGDMSARTIHRRTHIRFPQYKIVGRDLGLVAQTIAITQDHLALVVLSFTRMRFCAPDLGCVVDGVAERQRAGPRGLVAS